MVDSITWCCTSGIFQNFSKTFVSKLYFPPTLFFRDSFLLWVSEFLVRIAVSSLFWSDDFLFLAKELFYSNTTDSSFSASASKENEYCDLKNFKTGVKYAGFCNTKLCLSMRNRAISWFNKQLKSLLLMAPLCFRYSCCLLLLQN